MRYLVPAEFLPSEDIRIDRARGQREDGCASNIKTQNLVSSKTTFREMINLTYFHADRRGPSAFYLMFMPEERDASQSSPIIKTTYLSISGYLLNGVLVGTHLLSAHRVLLTCRYLHFRRLRIAL